LLSDRTQSYQCAYVHSYPFSGCHTSPFHGDPYHDTNSNTPDRHAYAGTYCYAYSYAYSCTDRHAYSCTDRHAYSCTDRHAYSCSFIH
jgi:hypothetical protein